MRGSRDVHDGPDRSGRTYADAPAPPEFDTAAGYANDDETPSGLKFGRRYVRNHEELFRGALRWLYEDKNKSYIKSTDLVDALGAPPGRIRLAIPVLEERGWLDAWARSASSTTYRITIHEDTSDSDSDSTSTTDP